MECNCGGSTKYSEHEVKSIEVAKEWYPDGEDLDVPLTIMKYVCASCGRQELLHLESKTKVGYDKKR